MNSRLQSKKPFNSADRFVFICHSPAIAGESIVCGFAYEWIPPAQRDVGKTSKKFNRTLLISGIHFPESKMRTDVKKKVNPFPRYRYWIDQVLEGINIRY